MNSTLKNHLGEIDYNILLKTFVNAKDFTNPSLFDKQLLIKAVKFVAHNIAINGSIYKPDHMVEFIKTAQIPILLKNRGEIPSADFENKYEQIKSSSIEKINLAIDKLQNNEDVDLKSMVYVEIDNAFFSFIKSISDLLMKEGIYLIRTIFPSDSEFDFLICNQAENTDLIAFLYFIETVAGAGLLTYEEVDSLFEKKIPEEYVQSEIERICYPIDKTDVKELGDFTGNFNYLEKQYTRTDFLGNEKTETKVFNNFNLVNFSPNIYNASFNGAYCCISMGIKYSDF